MPRPFRHLMVLACLMPALTGAVAAQTSMKISKTDIGASPEVVFGLIEDFRNWRRWSPADKADPAMKQTYGGAEKGPGATYEWAGGEKAGAGRAGVIEATPGKSMAVDLEFAKPVKGRLTLAFTLEAAGEATKMEVATQGDGKLVQYAMDRFFGGSLIRIACAAETSPKPLCKVLMRDFAPQ